MAASNLAYVSGRPEDDPELQANPKYRCCCGRNDIVRGVKIILLLHAIDHVLTFCSSMFYHDWDFAKEWIWVIDGRLMTFPGLLCIGLCWYAIRKGSPGLTIPYMVAICIEAVLSVAFGIVMLVLRLPRMSASAWSDPETTRVLEILHDVIFYVSGISCFVGLIWWGYCLFCIYKLWIFLKDWRMRNSTSFTANGLCNIGRTAVTVST